MRLALDKGMFVMAVYRFMLVFQWGSTEGNLHCGVRAVWVSK